MNDFRSVLCRPVRTDFATKITYIFLYTTLHIIKIQKCGTIVGSLIISKKENVIKIFEKLFHKQNNHVTLDLLARFFCKQPSLLFLYKCKPLKSVLPLALARSLCDDHHFLCFDRCLRYAVWYGLESLQDDTRLWIREMKWYHRVSFYSLRSPGLPSDTFGYIFGYDRMRLAKHRI